VFLRVIDALCFAGALFAAFATAALAGMLILEVFTVNLIAWSQPWSVEYGGYLLAATLFSGSGWTLRHGGHIRVSILSERLGETAQRRLDLVCTLFALGVSSFMAWASINYAVRSWERGSVSFYPTETPLVYPQAMLATSLTLLALGLLARALRLMRGEAAEAARAGATPEEGTSA
ncbi:MAG: TRAP transporter small permease, partial [Pseudomonadota bacterium]